MPSLQRAGPDGRGARSSRDCSDCVLSVCVCVCVYRERCRHFNVLDLMDVGRGPAGIAVTVYSECVCVYRERCRHFNVLDLMDVGRGLARTVLEYHRVQENKKYVCVCVCVYVCACVCVCVCACVCGCVCVFM